jgi:hypothetical protein
MLIALSVLFAVMTLGLEARGAPPVDEITWSEEGCAAGFPQATITANGNGKWAVIVVEVSSDGGETFDSLGEMYNPWKIEHGDPRTVAWAGDVVFRASDAKGNGSLVGEWIESAAIDCP